MDNQHSLSIILSVSDDSNAEHISSTATSDKQKPSQSSKRSREAIQRRNKQRHQKMKIKRQQHTIKRKMHHQWTLLQIKQYLDSLHIRNARVPHIYKTNLRLQFNNQQDQDFAEIKLEIDVFNENHYKLFIDNQQS